MSLAEAVSGSFITSKALALWANLLIKPLSSKALINLCIPDLDFKFRESFISSYEGDTVIIKRSDTADNGKIVVALIDEHEAMLKRIRRKGKTVALESANRNYETKIFGPDRVKVQGVLVSLYRNF